MTQIAERRFESTAVSFTQWMTLMRLCAFPEPISATQLSKEVCHDMGALTRVVDELERRGLVRRERSRRDRRAVELAITPAGRREAESAKRVVVDLLNELVDSYSDAEFNALLGLLQRMHGDLENAAGSSMAAAGASTAVAARSPAPPAPRARTATGGRSAKKSRGDA